MINEYQSELTKLGKRIQYYMDKRGKSLTQTAYEAGLAKSNLSKIVKGESNPRYTTLLAISEVLEVNIADVFKL